MKMKKKQKKFRNEEPLVWINVPLFTFRGLLRSGLQTFSTWAFTEDNDDKLFFPHGTTMQNLHGVSRPSILKVDFGQYVLAKGTVACLVRNRNMALRCRYCRRGEGIKYPDLDRLGAVDDGKVPAGAPDPQTAAALEKVDEIVHKVRVVPILSLNKESADLDFSFRILCTFFVRTTFIFSENTSTIKKTNLSRWRRFFALWTGNNKKLHLRWLIFCDTGRPLVLLRPWTFLMLLLRIQ